MRGEFEFNYISLIIKSCIAQTPRSPHFYNAGYIDTCLKCSVILKRQLGKEPHILVVHILCAELNRSTWKTRFVRGKWKKQLYSQVSRLYSVLSLRVIFSSIQTQKPLGHWFNLSVKCNTVTVNTVMLCNNTDENMQWSMASHQHLTVF